MRRHFLQRRAMGPTSTTSREFGMHERIAQHLMLFAAARTMHLEKRIDGLTVPVEPIRANGRRCAEDDRHLGGCWQT